MNLKEARIRNFLRLALQGLLRLSRHLVPETVQCPSPLPPPVGRFQGHGLIVRGPIEENYADALGMMRKVAIRSKDVSTACNSVHLDDLTD